MVFRADEANPSASAPRSRPDGRGRLERVLAALAAWMVASAAGAGEHATFLFELNGIPVGTVELTLTPEAGGRVAGPDAELERYTYRSTQLFTRETHQARTVRSASFLVDRRGCIVSGTATPDPSAAGERSCEAIPEARWLWRKPSPGCVPGREELGGRLERLCADEASSGAPRPPEHGPGSASNAPRRQVRGSIDGQRFVAEYRAESSAQRSAKASTEESARERLVSLTLGDARFVRVPDSHRPAAPPDLFSRGFAIEGRGAGVLALIRGSSSERAQPPRPSETLSPMDEPEAQALAERVRASFERLEPGLSDLDETAEPSARVGSCVAHARRFLRWARKDGAPRAEVVLGLLDVEGRAFPHAWVRVRTPAGTALELDPTHRGEVDRRRYLELGEAFGGALLELLAGRAHVTRR